MKTIAPFLAAICLMSIMIGCSLLNPPSEDLSGTWVLDQQIFTMNNIADTTSDSTSITLYLHSDDSFIKETSYPGVPTASDTGTWSATKSTITFVAKGGTESVWSYTLSASRLVLTQSVTIQNIATKTEEIYHKG